MFCLFTKHRATTTTATRPPDTSCEAEDTQVACRVPGICSESSTQGTGTELRAEAHRKTGGGKGEGIKKKGRGGGEKGKGEGEGGRERGGGGVLRPVNH